MTEIVPPGTFTVASWNILFDKLHGESVIPQFNRLGNIIETLSSLGEIDVAALLEVEKSIAGHHGEIISDKLGYGLGSWQRHSRKSEHIGMFGSAIDEPEFFDIGCNKQAALTYLGDVAVAAVHLKRPHSREHLREQHSQMTALLERVGDEPEAVIMGDFNTIPPQAVRRMLKTYGFVSALPMLTQTVPTEQYRHLLSPREKLAAKLAGGVLRVDDIYVKNLDVVEVGTLTGDSDHKLVYARLDR